MDFLAATRATRVCPVAGRKSSFLQDGPLVWVYYATLWEYDYSAVRPRAMPGGTLTGQTMPGA